MQHLLSASCSSQAALAAQLFRAIPLTEFIAPMICSSNVKFYLYPDVGGVIPMLASSLSVKSVIHASRKFPSDCVHGSFDLQIVWLVTFEA
jgi:hypothetical protein